MKKYRKVEIAAQVLDDMHPGWADKIDLSKIDMVSSTECILGQLFGDYRTTEGRKVVRQCSWFAFVSSLPTPKSEQKLIRMWAEAIADRTQRTEAEFLEYVRSELDAIGVN